MKLGALVLGMINRRKPNISSIIVILCLVALLGYMAWTSAGQSFAGSVSVIDGDTLEIHGQRFRLYGIDAPESHQTCRKEGKEYLCGKDAAFALVDAIGQQTVTCEKKDIDSYRRIVAICFAGQTELNRWMVANGHALAYRHYSDRYVREEMNAKAAHVGIWAGSFEMPWDYRHRK